MGIVNLWESERNREREREREAGGSFDKEKRRKFKQNTSNFKTQTKRLKISRVWNTYGEPIAKRPETCATCQHNRSNLIWILGLFISLLGFRGKTENTLTFSGGSVRFWCADGGRKQSPLAAPYQAVWGFNLPMTGTDISGSRWRRCGVERFTRFHFHPYLIL